MNITRTIHYTGERWYPSNSAQTARLGIIDMGENNGDLDGARWIVDNGMLGIPIEPGDWFLEDTPESCNPVVVSDEDFVREGYCVVAAPQ